MQRLGLTTVVVAALAACATDSDPETLTACPGTNMIQDPPAFQWTYHPTSATNPAPYYSGVLEYGEATFTIDGDTLTTRAYRQAGGTYSIPGPTITMQPGTKYVLRFHNLLPYQPASPEHNVFKDPNVSNLHTHGVHISGESPSDDVTRFFEGTHGGDFVYDIPADHMGGTYWYHAHHHGSTFLQVSSGAFGLMIIGDGNDGVPANVAAMTERQLAVAYLDPSVAGTGGDTLISGTLTPTWTVNGQVQGNLCMVANEWQHWRVLLADRQATNKTFAVGGNCEVALLARDGVWRTTAPLVLGSNSTSLTGASRADFAVRCTNDSVITINGATVANVLVNGTGNTTVGPYGGGATGGTWSAIRPPYLRDLRGETNLHTEEIRMGARAINGVKFDEAVPNLTLAADHVQSWTLTGANQHPFHLHVYQVQTQDCGGSYENGEYYDTVTSACHVRFDLNPATSTVYNGRTIMHCHILEHEDQGAMGWADVVGGLPPPTFPADTGVLGGYAASYVQGSAQWCTSDANCSDGNACNGAEVCDLATGACGAGAPPVCDDANPCTTDSCNPVSGCVAPPVPDGTACLDATVCNGSEICQSGTCTAGTPLDCDDGDLCTADSCDITGGCQHTPTTCTGDPTCSYDAVIGTITVTMHGVAGTMTIASGTIMLGTAACGTLTDTDSIVVDGSGALTITGDYVPGRTAEPTGASEIEFTINNDVITFDGATGDDHMVIVQSGADLNADGDQDLTLSGTQTEVTYKGGLDNDTLDASACTGPITLRGAGGTDHLIGGAGADTLYGDGNADTLEGNAGADNLYGGGANDVELGGSGADTFHEDASPNGADVLDGGGGADTVTYGARTGAVSITLGDGIANDGEAGENDGPVSIERATTGAGADMLVGSSAVNLLHGGPGNDTLRGGAGADTLYGDDGDDYLDGEADADKMYGGTGNDTLVGDLVAVDTFIGAAGNDTIIDNTDGNAESVSCGAGTDTAESNAEDTFTACENLVPP